MEGNSAPVSVVIPAYNEEASIRGTIRQVQEVLGSHRIQHEIVVVDDGSQDGTVSEARRANARVLRHISNRGYGAALKAGIRAAKYDVVVTTDADGTYPSDRIPEMLDKLKDSDMVVGARIGESVADPLIRRPAKWLLRRFAEYVTGRKILDLNSGLRAFRRQLAHQYLNILPNRFSFTTTMTVATLCDGYRISCVPIDYYRRSGQSKIVPWNAFEFAALIMRLSVLFNPLKVFVPVALLCVLLAIVKFVVDLIVVVRDPAPLTMSLLSQQMVSASTVVLFLAGLQIFLIGLLAEGLARKITEALPRREESVAVDVVEASVKADVDSQSAQDSADNQEG